MKNQQQGILWTCGDAEELCHETPAEAIDDWLVDFGENEVLPETVDVFGYAPLTLPEPEPLADSILTQLLEYLDEKYGHPYEHNESLTPKMEETALAFVRTVLQEYVVRAYEQVTNETCTVAEYLS